jgi:hypothetical protein
MAVDRREANMKVLQDTTNIQDKTKAAVGRMQKQAFESEEIGIKTLEEMRKQGLQLDNINGQVSNTKEKLDKSEALQNRFERWGGHWMGGSKNTAKAEAEHELAQKELTAHMRIKEVFEDQKFDTLGRYWKPVGLVLYTDPTVSCDDLFDPAIQKHLKGSSWKIDYSLPNADDFGWTYAMNFNILNSNGSGEKEPKWNSHVRRRKWRMVEENSAAGTAVNE